MKVSLSWIREHVDVTLTPTELAHQLSMLGLVVASLTPHGDDWIFECESLPNRPDWLSVYGIVREVSALTGKPRKEQPLMIKESERLVSGAVKVIIEDQELCPRYAARVVRNVKIGPSPRWLVERLESSGLRSINNVVDITNYILLAYGQPLHAFDHQTIEGGHLHVRYAREETFTTLDGVERKLNDTMLVIADDVKVLALAGIMGGKTSEVTSQTKHILLESAYFQPTSIRKTAKTLGLVTEASYRFERGGNVDMVVFALDCAAALIQQCAGGEVLAGAIDIYPEPLPQIVIPVSVERVNQIIGLELSAAEMSRYLRKIDFDVTVVSDDRFDVYVPNFRREVYREEDVAEEIARLFGYQHIPTTLPRLSLQQVATDSLDTLIQKVRHECVKLGFFETIHYSFISAADHKGCEGKAIRLQLPISEELSEMRQTLIPGLLKTAARNWAYSRCLNNYFELGKIYRTPHKQDIQEIGHTAWMSPDGFLALKGALQHVLGVFDIASRVRYKEASVLWCESGQACEIMVDDVVIGWMGVLSAAKLAQYDLKNSTAGWAALEINLLQLLPKARMMPMHTSIPKFPSSVRDMALKMPEAMRCEDVIMSIEQLRLPILKRVEFFDMYRGEQVGAGYKSLGYTLTFQAMDRTLTDAEVDKAWDDILMHLQKHLGISLREK